MRIIDTMGEMLSAFNSGRFRLEEWEAYIDAAVPDAKELCLDDVNECLAAGFSWENDFLPVLEAVGTDEEKRKAAIRTFHAVVDGLDETIVKRFGRTVDADLVLYLGLCSGAGWVTEVRGRRTVLFGIEKIMELGWHTPAAMTGLVLHELGHVYHGQYGSLDREPEALPDQLLWQLYTEGVAMVFEQEAAGDPEAFHQYDGGWKRWCDEHAEHLKQSFYQDLSSMTRENQRYFGDWVRFEGRGDTGYYLGARFVRFLLRSEDFDEIIRYGPDEVKDGFQRFLQFPL